MAASSPQCLRRHLGLILRRCVATRRGRCSGCSPSTPTFEAYCEHRWGFDRRHANRLIDGSRITGELGSIDPKAPVPTNERQARELAGLDPPKAAEVMADAAATAEDAGGQTCRIALLEIVRSRCARSRQHFDVWQFANPAINEWLIGKRKSAESDNAPASDFPMSCASCSGVMFRGRPPLRAGRFRSHF